MKQFVKRNIIPLAIVAIGVTYTFTQKAEFSSESTVKLTSTEDAAVIDSPLLPLPSDENNLVEEIINSKSFLSKLEASFGVSKHLEGVPGYSRGFRTFDNPDQLYNVISTYVTATYNESKNITDIKVNGYNPTFTKTLADGVLIELKKAVENFNVAKMEPQLETIKLQIETQESALEIAKGALDAFEKVNSLDNPEPILEGHVLSLTEVQKQIHEKQTEIEHLLTYLHPETHEVVIAKQQLHGLEQSARKIGSAALNDDRVKSLMMRHERFLADYKREFEALNLLKVQQIQLKQELLEDSKHLTVISEPMEPTDTFEPNRFKLLLITALIALFASAVQFTVARKRQRG